MTRVQKTYKAPSPAMVRMLEAIRDGGVPAFITAGLSQTKNGNANVSKDGGEPVNRFVSHYGPIGDDDGSVFGDLRRRNLFDPVGRSMPISPLPGDRVVLMAASPGEWDEDTLPIEAVLDDGPDGWAVKIDGDDYIIQRGSDGRWWTYGALHENRTRK